MQTIHNQADASTLLGIIGKIVPITAFKGKIGPITPYKEYIGPIWGLVALRGTLVVSRANKYSVKFILVLYLDIILHYLC